MITGESGTYALILKAKKTRPVTIGKLGRYRFDPGYYVYVGSAFGPGGLDARLAHHLRKARAPHWHMDYLRPSVDILQIWYTTDRRSREHQWAERLAVHQRASLPVAKFGASDCSCRAHLFRFESLPSGDYFRRIVRRQHPGHGVIRIFRQTEFFAGARNSGDPALKYVHYAPVSGKEIHSNDRLLCP